MKAFLGSKWMMSVSAGVGLLLSGCGPADLDDGSDEAALARKKSALLVDDIYSTLKNVESQLPIFPASQTVAMGSFDVYSGDFQGMDYSYSISPITHKPVKGPVVVPLSAKGAVLTFQLYNSTAYPIVLTLGSHSVTAPAGSTSISLDLGSDFGGSWTLSAGSVWHTGSIIFTRHGVNGAGAFTLSALPITIVYEPPMNQAKTNSAQVTLSQETTSVVSLSRSDDNAFQGASDWSQVTEAAATVDAIANPVAPGSGQISNALKYVGSALGTVSTTVTQGTTVNSDHTLGLSTTNAVTVSTQLKKGPGLGDVYFFYRNPRIAWFMLDGQVSTTLLDPGTLVQTTAEQMKLDLSDLDAGIKTPTQTATGVTADTLRNLLALDPTSSPSGRFVKEFSLSISGGSGFSQTVTHTLTTTDTQSTSKYTTTVKDAHAGWLSAIGIGETQTGQTTSKVTMTSSRSNSTTQTQSATINLSAAAGETYNADIYFDRLFGTFRVVKPFIRPCCIVAFPKTDIVYTRL